MDNKTQIQEGNKLIAEFMGGKYDEFDRWWILPKMNTMNLEYDQSWDWLMPVVIQINKICDEKEKENPVTKTGNLDDYTTWRSWSYHRVRPALRLEYLFQKTVEFIKWYNESKLGEVVK